MTVITSAEHEQSNAKGRMLKRQKSVSHAYGSYGPELYIRLLADSRKCGGHFLNFCYDKSCGRPFINL